MKLTRLEDLQKQADMTPDYICKNCKGDYKQIEYKDGKYVVWICQSCDGKGVHPLWLKLMSIWESCKDL